MELSSLFYVLGRWSGLIGFTCLSLLIFSGDIARFFDRFIGLDKIIKFQKKFSLFTAFFVIFHPIFFILSNIGFSQYLIPRFSIFALFLGTISFYIFIIVMLASLMYKRVSYLVFQYIHILTYILFFFGLYHAYNWGQSVNFLAIKILYYFLIIIVIIGIVYRTQYKLIGIFRDKFYLKEIIKETKDTFSLILETKGKIDFKAGQFYFLRINKNKLYARHPFTVSSAPNDNYLRFTIKDTGRFTKTALNLKKGEEIILDGPFGVFTFKEKEKEKKDLVFIAGGVGITPFLSMIKDNFFKEEKKNIFLFYASRAKEDIILKKEIDNINENWFKKVYVLSREKVDLENYENGYIDKELIEKYIKNIDNCLFYICGSEKMKKDSLKALINLKVKRKNIIIEDFFW